MPRARASRKSSGENESSQEEDPDKDTHRRFFGRSIRLLRVNCCARRPERPSPAGAERRERISRIKAEIKAGTYETREKLEIAISRLIDDITSRREKK